MITMDFAIYLLQAALERKRQKRRRMKKLLRARRSALRAKVKELEMLTRMKQDLLAMKAAGQKLIDDFMVFIEAAENAQGFDEEAMMQAIQTLMNSETGGGFAADYGGVNNAAPETAQDLGEEATMAAVKGPKNDGSTDDAGGCGGSNK